jgi:SAM-dependent methyltransferase
VEIAPGNGRWTQYLLPHCRSYLGIDVAELAITTCQERFSEYSNVKFAVNDGLSLPMVADGSANLVFSFDSLVHSEANVISAYLEEFHRILDPVGGVAFIHHSNLGEYRVSAPLRDMFGRVFNAFLPTKAAMTRVGLADWHCDRGRSMTAARFAELARSAGLSCIGQEVISWVSPLVIDCISVLTLPGSNWDREPVYVRNRHFHTAARSSATCAQVFAPQHTVSR